MAFASKGRGFGQQQGFGRVGSGSGPDGDVAGGPRARVGSKLSGAELRAQQRGPSSADGLQGGGAAQPAPPLTADDARELCLAALDSRPHTRAELEQLLDKKGVAPATVAPLLDRLAEVGLLDDKAFASEWVEQRHRTKGLSGRVLTEELRKKGVSGEAVDEAVAALDPVTELATARGLVDRKLGGTRGLTPDVRTRRLAGMLARKGYSPHVSFQAVREALAAEGEADELAELFAELEGPASGDGPVPRG